MITFENYSQYKAACTDVRVNSYMPPSGPFLWTCETCGKCSPRSEGFGLENNGMYCYACCDTRQRESLLARRELPHVAYLSTDGRQVTTWTGAKLGDVMSYRSSGIGWHGSTIARIRMRDVHGQWWHGRGPGTGMCLTLRPMKTPR